MLICAFMGMFSETSLNIALTTLMNDFRISAATAQWLTTGYLLTLGIIMPFTALLIQRYTTRRLFFVSTTSLTLGTIVGGMSVNFSMLLIARILQAIGMGILLPLMSNTILVIFAKEKRGTAMGTLGLVLSFAPAMGPAISGILIQYMSWHFIFWLLLPFILLGMFIGYRNLINVTENHQQKIDFLSVISSTLGFGGIVFGLSQTEESLLSPIVIVPIIIGIISLAFFIKRQNTENPILDLSVFKYPIFVTGSILVLICVLIFQGTMIILPMYLQTGAGLTVLLAGLVLLPGSATNGILQMLGGKIFDKYGYKILVIPGFIIMLVTLFFLKTLTPNSSIILIMILDMTLMAGTAIVWTGAQTHALNQLPPKLYAHGSATLNTMLQVIGAIGVSISVAVLSSTKSNYLASSQHPNSINEISSAIASGAGNVFGGLMIIAIIGLLISFWMILRDKKQELTEI
ncbi:major facilitator superfamily permease [Companilactobacillus kimchiensis]|uniref:Major facilitator superfamily permease n=2 Tax=Companilactobacillus kimchiensis TaxID=993692 RepID=A0A0R2LFI4_9LACO|nr:major facilitator superfamily permease [Companilactobacillus kimchiensis]